MRRTNIADIALCTLMFFGSAGLEASARDATVEEARDLLRQCLKAQRLADRISMHGVTDIEALASAEDRTNLPRRWRAEFWVRRDGLLFDASYTMLMLDKRQEASCRLRDVVNKEVYSSTGRALTTKRAKSGITSTDTAKGFATAVMNEWLSMALDGYFMSDGKRMAELMQDAADLRVAGEANVEGTACKIVEGHTTHGFLRLWIAPAMGHTVHRFECEKGPNDIHFEGLTVSQHGKKIGRPLVGCSAVLDAVKVQKIGEVFFPFGGRLTEWFIHADGVKVGSVYTYQRTKVDLHPRFEGTNAFVVDLPDGTRVTNLDDRDSGMVYQLQKGKPVAVYREFTGDVKGSWPRVWKGARILGAVASVLAFIALAAWIVWRRAARRAWQ